MEIKKQASPHDNADKHSQLNSGSEAQSADSGVTSGSTESESPQGDATAEKPKRSRPKPKMALTRNLRRPTEYVQALNGEFSEWAFNEERAVAFKGHWREKVFKQGPEYPIDLEIGTGNGFHFARLARDYRDRGILGIELKFKPLIQSIRRAIREGSENARILRYDASRLEDIFAEGELDDVYIHFPDPWSKKRQWKHRLIQTDFLEILHGLMRPGSKVEFKTDSLDYFEWAIERMHKSPFKVLRETRDLHRSEWKDENFVTHFESIFLSQGLSINYALLVRE